MPRTATFYYDSLPDKPFHAQKSLSFETYLTFWDNSYTLERDVFIHRLPPDTTLTLVVEYYPEISIGRDSFFCYTDTIPHNRSRMLSCGLGIIAQGELIRRKGEIDKAKADRILVE